MDDNQLTHHADPKPTPRPPAQPKSFKRWFLSLFTCFSLMIAIGSLMMSQRITDQVQDLALATKKIQQKLEQQPSTEQLLNKLAQSEQRIQAILKEQGYQPNDWQIQKIHYYLELAQISIDWTNHTATTLALLHQVDIILAKIQDPKLNALRQALATDIITLEQRQTIDIDGIVAKIEAIQLQLNTVHNLSPKIPPLIKQSTSNDPADWRHIFLSNLKQLEGLVIIRHQDHSALNQLSPLSIAALRDNIRLNLQQAEIGAVQYQQNLYHLALNAALVNIQHCFNPHDPTIEAIIHNIKELNQISLTQPKFILKATNELPLDKPVVEFTS